VEILSDSDQKSWDNVTEDGNPRFLTTMSNVPLHVLDHRTMDRVQNSRIQWDLMSRLTMIPNSKLVHDMAPNLPATNHRAARRKRANIAELLLASTPTDHFKISNHETIQRPTVMNITEISDVDELSDIQKQFAQLFTRPKRHLPGTTLTAEERRRRRQDISEHVNFLTVRHRSIRCQS
jgi:hypothetical protein